MFGLCVGYLVVIAGSVKLLLLVAAGSAVLYALARVIWQGGDAELGAGLAVLTAAVCTGSAGVIEAIDRARPKVVSSDNGARKDGGGS